MCCQVGVCTDAAAKTFDLSTPVCLVLTIGNLVRLSIAETRENPPGFQGDATECRHAAQR